MAQQTTITLTDDIDGGKAVETVSFALDGRSYEIDLNKKNAAALRKALADFTAAARKVRGGAKASSSRGARGAAGNGSSGSVDARAVREWAQENGITVSARGRVPADVLEQYQAATS